MKLWCNYSSKDETPAKIAAQAGMHAISHISAPISLRLILVLKSANDREAKITPTTKNTIAIAIYKWMKV